MKWKDFLIEDAAGHLQLDVKAASQLSLEDFAGIHIEEMANFIKFFRQQNGYNPTCPHCRREVTDPEDLRRYFGRSLHTDCFVDEYAAEKHKLNDYEIAYFDLISRLNPCGSRC